MSVVVLGQNNIDLKASFNIEKSQIKISQTIQYHNTSDTTLYSIYLNDWNNSFSTKKTPLAKRLAEEYKREFHFKKNKERGFTVITSMQQHEKSVDFERLKEHPDIIKVQLNTPLQANETYTLELNYIVQLPSDKFTRYGQTSLNNLNLRYWYITPAIYNGEWQYYSNKDLDDLFIPKSKLRLELVYPKNYYLASELNEISNTLTNNRKTTVLEGDNRINSKLFLNKSNTFNTIETDYLTIVSNIDNENLNLLDEALVTDKVLEFITENLGDYPHEKLLITAIDYKKDPIYGLNLLPDFIRPFPDSFQYELKLLKTTLQNYLENTLLLNPRKDYWLIGGLQTYYLMKYVDENYPEMKIFGTLSNIWGIKSFHASTLNFNDQYSLMFMDMARRNIDQPLNTSKDSLLKFNKNIANKYKAGIGLKYLEAYIESNTIEDAISEYIAKYKIKHTSTKDFEDIIKSKTNKDIDWFFTDYLNTNKKIDYKIKKVQKTKDSITVTIKNKRNSQMPIELFELNNDSIISKTWISGIKNEKVITLPNTSATKLVLNHDKLVPEYNNRNNTKSLKASLLNRPFQLRLIKDVEDSRYNQVFLMPIVEYNNIYDGLVLGARAYNKTVLKKELTYKIAPQYATKSNAITGSANLVYKQYIDNVKSLYKIHYTLSGSYSSYAEDLFVRSFKPSIAFLFKDTENLRSNKRQTLNFRYISINKDEDINNILTEDSDPDYGVFNIRYRHSNPGLLSFSSWHADFQVSQTFSKLSFNYEFRRLFQNNKQLNIRVFAGTFISNKNDANSDYFSFALDRPTDYLFDYAYLGRSESSGVFSQQIIIAEGGFKSKLDTPFANQWMTTLNMSTTIWKYILAYGDVGAVKNKYQNPKFVYDSGIRVNLVEDYFEIYFPVYSNLGWEISQPSYSQKIRFKFTIDIQSLLGLFRRRWY